MQKGGRKTFSKSKFKLSQKTMHVLCHQPAQHDEVLQCFHHIGVLTVERHSRGGKMMVRKFFRDMFLKPNQNSCDIKTRWHCLFCDQGDRSKEREKCQKLIVSRTSGFDDDKYAERQDEWECRVHLSRNYILLVQFTRYDVQTSVSQEVAELQKWECG